MAQAKHVLPIRYADISLDGPFEGFTFKAKISVKLGVIRAMQSGEFDKIMKSLRDIIVDWDFVDEEGKPMPKPNDPPIFAKDDNGNDTDEIEWDAFDELTLDLTQAIVRAFTAKTAEVPNG